MYWSLDDWLEQVAKANKLISNNNIKYFCSNQKQEDLNEERKTADENFDKSEEKMTNNHQEHLKKPEEKNINPDQESNDPGSRNPWRIHILVYLTSTLIWFYQYVRMNDASIYIEELV